MVIGPELLFSMPALALAVGMRSCEPPPPPQIEVNTVEAPIQTDNTKSVREVTTLAAGAYRPAGAWAHATGLTVGIFQFETKYKIRANLELLSGAGCYWLDAVTVELNFVPTVYVAREYAPGTCRHAAILAHEMKHVGVDREILATYLPIVRSRLREVSAELGVIGPKPKTAEGEVRRQIGSTIEQAVNQVMEKIQAERRRRQQTVDTPQEYRAVQAACR